MNVLELNSQIDEDRSHINKGHITCILIISDKFLHFMENNVNVINLILHLK